METSKLIKEFDILHSRSKSPRFDHGSERLAKLVRVRTSSQPPRTERSSHGKNRLEFKIDKLNQQYLYKSENNKEY